MLIVSLQTVHLKANTASCICRNYDTATLKLEILDRKKKHQQHCAGHQQSWRQTKYGHIVCTLQTRQECYKAKKTRRNRSTYL